MEGGGGGGVGKEASSVWSSEPGKVRMTVFFFLIFVLPIKNVK